MTNAEPIAHVRKNDDGSWAEPQLLIEHFEEKRKIKFYAN